jgi:cytochrome c553
MRRRWRDILVAGGFLAAAASGVAGCAAAGASLPTAEELMGSAAASREGEALRRGRAIAATECTGCHRLFWPRDYSPAEWRVIARTMGLRASLAEEQIRDLSAYLDAASRATRDGK